MHSELDVYDRRILALLQEDASLSSAQIAEQVGLSQSPCWRRIQRLKGEGVIRAQVTLLDRKKIGLNTQIFAEVKLNAHGRSNFTEFTEAIRGFPQVLECYVLMGAVDFLLRIVTPDIEAYERFFFEKLSMVPGIRRSTRPWPCLKSSPRRVCRYCLEPYLRSRCFQPRLWNTAMAWWTRASSTSSLIGRLASSCSLFSSPYRRSRSGLSST